MRIIVFLFFLYFFPSFAQDKVNQLDALGKKHGIWTKNYDNGNLRYKGQFEHGIEVGTFEFYAENGSKKPIATKEYFKNNDSISVTFFNLKGNVESKGTMINQSKEGLWTYYFADTKRLMRIENYKENYLHGRVEIFYKNGKIAEKSDYSTGKRNGMCQRFNEDGKIVENLAYLYGTLHGAAIIYDEKGEIYAKGMYEKGLRVGEWEFKLNGTWIKTNQPDKISTNR